MGSRVLRDIALPIRLGKLRDRRGTVFQHGVQGVLVHVKSTGLRWANGQKHKRTKGEGIKLYVLDLARKRLVGSFLRFRFRYLGCFFLEVYPLALISEERKSAAGEKESKVKQRKEQISGIRGKRKC